jgi:hypothetical protein
MYAPSLPERTHPAWSVALSPQSIVRAAQQHFFGIGLTASRNFKVRT